jgi:hypothetical protein
MHKQERPNWCWAAAVQEVLARHHIVQTQTQIATRMDRRGRDRPAYANEVAKLLQTYGLRAWETGRPGTPQEAVHTLGMGWLILASTQKENLPTGHMVAFLGLDLFNFVRVGDPYTGVVEPCPLQALYVVWRWRDSVIVGR